VQKGCLDRFQWQECDSIEKYDYTVRHDCTRIRRWYKEKEIEYVLIKNQ
jgi:hypothetical protein